MGGLIPLDNGVTAVVGRAGATQIAPKGVSIDKARLCCACRFIKHGVLHVDPLNNLSVTNGDIGVRGSVGNVVTWKTISHPEEVQPNRGGNQWT